MASLCALSLPATIARHKQSKLLSTITIRNRNLAAASSHSRPNCGRQ
jgi:hypothetical protein